MNHNFPNKFGFIDNTSTTVPFGSISHTLIHIRTHPNTVTPPYKHPKMYARTRQYTHARTPLLLVARPPWRHQSCLRTASPPRESAGAPSAETPCSGGQWWAVTGSNSPETCETKDSPRQAVTGDQFHYLPVIQTFGDPSAISPSQLT